MNFLRSRGCSAILLLGNLLVLMLGVTYLQVFERYAKLKTHLAYRWCKSHSRVCVEGSAAPKSNEAVSMHLIPQARIGSHAVPSKLPILVQRASTPEHNSTWPLFTSNSSMHDDSPHLEAASIQLKQNKTKQRKYALSAIVVLRVNFPEDRLRNSFREVREWMEWLFYSGVDHVYVYDNWQFEEERILHCLKPYIDGGFVTYHDWGKKNHHKSQMPAQEHWLTHHRNEVEWQLQADYDEYPHIRKDTKEGWLLRLTQRHKCSIYFQNQFWLDTVKNKSEGEFVIERFLRRDRNWERYPSRSKCLYQAEFLVKTPDPHQVILRDCPKRNIVPIEEGALEHYWGHRNVAGVPNFDFGKFFRNTIGPDYTMRDVASEFKKQHTPRVPYYELPPGCRFYPW
mmetsp:Transcript_31672/g.49582  ORF Transcript_31672/g.49582 Transcript_31672/m.49582 type:complete len:397 (+) Transcript_31672:159-1349(+)